MNNQRLESYESLVVSKQELCGVDVEIQEECARCNNGDLYPIHTSSDTESVLGLEIVDCALESIKHLIDPDLLS